MRRFSVPASFQNPLSAIGLLLALGSLVIGLALLAIHYLETDHNPYFGIFLFLVVPAFFILGLVLVPLGAWKEKRRRRRGDLSEPRWLTIDLNKKSHRTAATIFVIGAGIAIVFGAAVSYVLMMVSHIVLRLRAPEMHRPYRTPGGIATTGFALVIAVIAVIATFLVDHVAALGCLLVFAGFMAYFGLYSRHHLVANSPDEEFAALAAAEDELR